VLPTLFVSLEIALAHASSKLTDDHDRHASHAATKYPSDV
jgi:hypothetical protein